MAERFDRLTEQLEIITGLWRTLPGERFDYAGTHYTLADSPALPKPVQQPAPPVIVGGIGKRRTPMLAARFAAEYNVAFKSIETAAAAFERAAAACAEIGRDPAELVRSAAQPIAVGRDDDEVARRALTIGKAVAELKADGLAGTPAEVVDRLGQWRERAGDHPLLPAAARPGRPRPDRPHRRRGGPSAALTAAPRAGSGTRSRSSATTMSPANSAAASAPKAVGVRVALGEVGQHQPAHPGLARPPGRPARR